MSYLNVGFEISCKMFHPLSLVPAYPIQTRAAMELESEGRTEAEREPIDKSRDTYPSFRWEILTRVLESQLFRNLLKGILHKK